MNVQKGTVAYCFMILRQAKDQSCPSGWTKAETKTKGEASPVIGHCVSAEDSDDEAVPHEHSSSAKRMYRNVRLGMKVCFDHVSI